MRRMEERGHDRRARRIGGVPNRPGHTLGRRLLRLSHHRGPMETGVRGQQFFENSGSVSAPPTRNFFLVFLFLWGSDD